MNSIIRYIKFNIITPRVLKFSIVGASGVLVNMGMLFFLTEVLNLFYMISSVLAIEISIVTNFVLNDLWTWHDRKKKNLLARVFQYHISVGITAVVINWLLLIILTEFFGLYYLISNLIGISAGTLSNFVINDLWTFKEKRNWETLYQCGKWFVVTACVFKENFVVFYVWMSILMELILDLVSECQKNPLKKIYRYISGF